MPIYIKHKIDLDLLKATGVSYSQVVKKTAKYYSVTKSMLSSIFNGNDNVTAETVIKMCLAYNITPNQLLINPDSDDGTWDVNIITAMNKEMKNQLRAVKLENRKLNARLEISKIDVRENKRLRKIINKFIK